MMQKQFHGKIWMRVICIRSLRGMPFPSTHLRTLLFTPNIPIRMFPFDSYYKRSWIHFPCRRKRCECKTAFFTAPNSIWIIIKNDGNNEKALDVFLIVSWDSARVNFTLRGTFFWVHVEVRAMFIGIFKLIVAPAHSNVIAVWQIHSKHLILGDTHMGYAHADEEHIVKIVVYRSRSPFFRSDSRTEWYS